MSTLTQIITTVRTKLDDLHTPYGWSNEFLTTLLNETVNEIVAKARLIEDASTAAICTHALLANGYALTLSPRIVGITRVELASTGALLQIFDDVRELDYYSSGWKTAASSVPRFLVKGGLGTNVGRVWPATLLADSILLTVTRLPLVDMVWATDQALSPEIEELYHDKLQLGIIARAYEKADSDTENQNKASEYREKWVKAMDEIMLEQTHKASVFQTGIPHPGWM